MTDEPQIKDDAVYGPLGRYMAILEMLAPFADGLSAAELEQALDLPKTTVNRLLHGLVAAGMVAAVPGQGRMRSFRLGGRMLRLLHSSPDTGWIESMARRPLRALAETTGHAAFLVRFDGTSMRSISCEAPETPVRMYVAPGMDMPVHAAASAKVILSFQSLRTIETLLAQDLPNYTPQTLDRDMLYAELAEIRIRGYATDRAEHVIGLGSIACPIFTPPGPVIYAVGLTGPYARVIEQDFPAHLSAVADAALRLGKVLQLPLHHTGPHEVEIRAGDNQQ